MNGRIMAGVRLLFMSIVLAAHAFANQIPPGAERIDALRAIVSADPSRADDWQQLGLLLADGGRYAEARPCFEKVAALRPGEGDGLAMLGMAEFRERRYDDALAHLERARLLRFRTPGLEALLDYHSALLMIRRGDFDAARKGLSALAKRGARSDQLSEAEGLAALRLRKLPDQLDELERKAVRDAGAVVVESRHVTPAEARSRWLDFVTRYAKLPGVHYAHGQYLLGAGQQLEAIRAFEAELEISPQDALAAAQIAASQLVLGESEAALRSAGKTIELDRNLFAGHLLKGRALLALDRDEEAIPALETAAALAPESERVFTTLGIAYTRMGRKADAARASAEAARLHRIETGRMGAPEPRD